MTTKEKIKIMQHYEDGNSIEVLIGNGINQGDWEIRNKKDWGDLTWCFGYAKNNYRIYEEPEQKQTVAIEKWLFEDKFRIKCVLDIEKDAVKCYCHEFQMTKLKLIDTYEVEL